MRNILNCKIALACALMCSAAKAQETPGKRLAGVVAVAVSEYKLGVDATGKITAQEELDEARSFFQDAKEVAARITGANRVAVGALVDSLASAVKAAKPSTEVDALHNRLITALGDDAALDYPSRHVDLLAGRTIYEKRCATCHGMGGAGDGPAGKGMNPPPAVLVGGDSRDVAPGLMYRVVSVGVKGTAMPAWADTLSSDQRWDVISYIDSLRSVASGSAGSAPSINGAAIQATVLSKLDSALASAHEGKLTDASDRAFDAYAAFEPLESAVRPRDPGLVSRLEGEFLSFRTAVRAGKLAEADSALARVRAGLPEMIAMAEPAGSPWTAFGESLLIILREGFEAILIITAIVAMLSRSGNQKRVKEVWLGAGAGVLASLLTAAVLQKTLKNLPATRETIEGATLLVAVAVLFSVSYWIMSKAESRKWQAYVRDQMSSAVQSGGRAAVVGVGFLVVYREGAETALFYQALLQSPQASSSHIIGGLLVGSVLLGGVYAALSKFGVKIPLRQFFAVTGGLLYAMSIVFMGKGIRELQEGGAVSTTLLHSIPTIDAIGIYPSVETIAGQLVLVLLFAIALWHTFVRPLRQSANISPGGPGPSSA